MDKRDAEIKFFQRVGIAMKFTSRCYNDLANQLQAEKKQNCPINKLVNNHTISKLPLTKQSCIPCYSFLYIKMIYLPANRIFMPFPAFILSMLCCVTLTDGVTTSG